MCLENIQDLDTLFKEWRKKHESEERGTRYTDTFPYKKDYTCSDDFNKSFCCDGFIEYNKDYEKTILFIFREANISDKLKGKELHPETDYNYFHMKKEWENHLPDVLDILKEGSKVAKETAAKTLEDVRHSMRIDYFTDNNLLK